MGYNEGEVAPAMREHPGARVSLIRRPTVSNYTPENPQIKRCPKCGQEYPATTEFFHKNGKRLKSICKTCVCRYVAEWRERRPDYQAQWRANNPDYPKQWYQENRTKHLEQTRARYQANPRRKLDANKEWQRKNPERHRLLNRAQTARRRARKRENGGSYTPQDIECAYQLQKGRCWYCQCELNGKYEIDHRIPLSRGGSNDAANIVISCQACNRAKKAKMPWEFNGRLL